MWAKVLDIAHNTSHRCSLDNRVCISAPNDHFTAGPDCRVSVSGQSGALVVLVAVQLSVPGRYLPPVFKPWLLLTPPQTIIILPVQTAV